MIIAEITYTELFDRVQSLSSFEAREAYTASGEDDYERVHITEQDRPWIEAHIQTCAKNIYNALMPLADSMEDTDHNIHIMSSQVREERPGKGTIRKILYEYIVAYVLMQWCREYLPARVQVYVDMMEDLRASARKELHRLSTPIKRRRIKLVNVNQPIISVTHETPEAQS